MRVRAPPLKHQASILLLAVPAGGARCLSPVSSSHRRSAPGDCRGRPGLHPQAASSEPLRAPCLLPDSSDFPQRPP